MELSGKNKSSRADSFWWYENAWVGVQKWTDMKQQNKRHLISSWVSNQIRKSYFFETKNVRLLPYMNQRVRNDRISSLLAINFYDTFHSIFFSKMTITSRKTVSQNPFRETKRGYVYIAFCIKGLKFCF